MKESQFVLSLMEQENVKKLDEVKSQVLSMLPNFDNFPRPGYAFKSNADCLLSQQLGVSHNNQVMDKAINLAKATLNKNLIPEQAKKFSKSYALLSELANLDKQPDRSMYSDIFYGGINPNKSPDLNRSKNFFKEMIDNKQGMLFYIQEMTIEHAKEDERKRMNLGKELVRVRE